MTTIVDLDNQVKAVCPAFGVSCGDLNDNTTWSIQYKPEATVEQQAAAVQVLHSYTSVDPINIGIQF